MQDRHTKPDAIDRSSLPTHPAGYRNRAERRRQAKRQRPRQTAEPEPRVMVFEDFNDPRWF